MGGEAAAHLYPVKICWFPRVPYTELSCPLFYIISINLPCLCTETETYVFVQKIYFSVKPTDQPNSVPNRDTSRCKMYRLKMYDSNADIYSLCLSLIDSARFTSIWGERRGRSLLRIIVWFCWCRNIDHSEYRDL